MKTQQVRLLLQHLKFKAEENRYETPVNNIGEEPLDFHPRSFRISPYWQICFFNWSDLDRKRSRPHPQKCIFILLFHSIIHFLLSIYVFLKLH